MTNERNKPNKGELIGCSGAALCAGSSAELGWHGEQHGQQSGQQEQGMGEESSLHCSERWSNSVLRPWQ